MRFARLLLFLLFLLPVSLSDAWAEIEPLISFARDDSHIYARTSFVIPEGYHAYSSAADSGLPTRIELRTIDGEEARNFYPEGVDIENPLEKGKKINAYKGTVTLLSIFPAASAGDAFTGKLSLLLCSARHCMPVKKTLAGEIPLQMSSLANSGWDFSGFAPELKSIVSEGELAAEAAPPPRPIKDEVEQADTPQAESPLPIKESQTPLAAPEDFDLMLKPVYFSANLEVFALWQALLFGIIAGLLLNAMPCVLPVLGLKINALFGSGNPNDKKTLSAFRRHNIFFITGVMTFFTLLALLLGMADLLWGQLFQSQTLVLLILMLVFLMGLSMFGVFTLPVLNLKLGENSKSPVVQAYCSGLICTFLATPCSGPLLGGVLAWAFTQPLPCLLAVFWAVGVGMSLPYIAFCIWPQVGRILPRPGKWMHIFETILGFMLLGTSIYLLSILPENKRLHILCALLAIAFCAWLLGKFCNLVAPVWKQITGSCFALCVIGFSILWIMQPPAPGADWKSFEVDFFTENHGKKNMLLEFTADWCPNCKYLEATVLTEEMLKDLQNDRQFDLIKVDITNPSPYAEKLLNMLGSKSIPVTAMFPKGDNFRKPLVLRDLYGKETLKNAIREIF